MENENLTPENIPEEDIYAREEKLEKTLRTIRKAVFMRIFLTLLLIVVMVKFRMELIAVCLMVLVIVINLTGMLPLVAEWKKRRAELKQLYDMEE